MEMFTCFRTKNDGDHNSVCCCCCSKDNSRNFSSYYLMMDNDLFLFEDDGDGEDISEHCRAKVKNVLVSALIFLLTLVLKK